MLDKNDKIVRQIAEVLSGSRAVDENCIGEIMAKMVFESPVAISVNNVIASIGRERLAVFEPIYMTLGHAAWRLKEKGVFHMVQDLPLKWLISQEMLDFCREQRDRHNGHEAFVMSQYQSLEDVELVGQVNSDLPSEVSTIKAAAIRYLMKVTDESLPVMVKKINHQCRWVTSYHRFKDALDELVKKNYVSRLHTKHDPVYQIHPIFKQFIEMKKEQNKMNKPNYDEELKKQNEVLAGQLTGDSLDNSSVEHAIVKFLFSIPPGQRTKCLDLSLSGPFALPESEYSRQANMAINDLHRRGVVAIWSENGKSEYALTDDFRKMIQMPQAEPQGSSEAIGDIANKFFTEPQPGSDEVTAVLRMIEAVGAIGVRTEKIDEFFHKAYPQYVNTNKFDECVNTLIREGIVAYLPLAPGGKYVFVITPWFRTMVSRKRATGRKEMAEKIVHGTSDLSNMTHVIALYVYGSQGHRTNELRLQIDAYGEEAIEKHMNQLQQSVFELQNYGIMTVGLDGFKSDYRLTEAFLEAIQYETDRIAKLPQETANEYRGHKFEPTPSFTPSYDHALAVAILAGHHPNNSIFEHIGRILYMMEKPVEFSMLITILRGAVTFANSVVENEIEDKLYDLMVEGIVEREVVDGAYQFSLTKVMRDHVDQLRQEQVVNASLDRHDQAYEKVMDDHGKRVMKPYDLGGVLHQDVYYNVDLAKCFAYGSKDATERAHEEYVLAGSITPGKVFSEDYLRQNYISPHNGHDKFEQLIKELVRRGVIVTTSTSDPVKWYSLSDKFVGMITVLMTQKDKTQLSDSGWKRSDISNEVVEFQPSESYMTMELHVCGMSVSLDSARKLYRRLIGFVDNQDPKAPDLGSELRVFGIVFDYYKAAEVIKHLEFYGVAAFDPKS